MVRYESTASLVTAMTSISLGFSFFAVVLRFVSRGMISKRINPDDWLIAFAWVCSISWKSRFARHVLNLLRRYCLLELFLAFVWVSLAPSLSICLLDSIKLLMVSFF